MYYGHITYIKTIAVIFTNVVIEGGHHLVDSPFLQRYYLVGGFKPSEKY